MPIEYQRFAVSIFCLAGKILAPSTPKTQQTCPNISFLTFLLVLLAVPALGQPKTLPKHPVIPGITRFFPEKADPIAGDILLGELNCLACHVLPGNSNSAKRAPILSDVGQRVRSSYIRQFLLDPGSTKPGTTMPHLLAAIPKPERKEIVDALVQFLANGQELSESPPLPQDVRSGKTLFTQVGCMACHSLPNEPQWQTSVHLGKLSSKYSVESLAQFIREPLHVRPGGRMPQLNLNDQEARRIASFLLRDIEVAANATFEYYEGSWQNLPDFSKLKPKSRGRSFGLDLNSAERREQFGLVFKSMVRIPKDGDYEFFLGSDDGSRLLLNNKELVRVDGVHPTQFKSQKINLKAGAVAIVVEYFEQGGQEELKLEIQGPGMPRRSILGLLSIDGKPTVRKNSPPPATPNPELVAQGKKHFVSLGCVSCHEIKRSGADLDKARPKTPVRISLADASGCLSNNPKRSVDFRLSDTQKESIVAAIVARKESLKRQSLSDSIHSTMIRFNCYACHKRDDFGGVESIRNAFFETTEKEMGDEARIPPLLTGVGAKLKKDWLKHVLDNGAKDRPYMKVRMPRFGSSNVGSLVDDLEKVDKLKRVVEFKLPQFPNQRALKSAGRQLVGAKGLSCVKCHTFANERATGVQAISMTTMTKRLKQDWFHQYMYEPTAYRPGTRMPATWPKGQTFFKTLLAGHTPSQIHSVWVYLSDAEKARKPIGIGKQPIELMALGGTVLYRNFIQGAGTRAIGVGYSTEGNLAFNANTLSIDLIWKGAFIDAAKHWTGRGQGFEGPLGDSILSLPTPIPFANLKASNNRWPGDVKSEDYRFRGYRLDSKGRPTFRYTIGKILVADFPSIELEKNGTGVLRRKIILTASEKPNALYWRPVTGKAVKQTSIGWSMPTEEWTLNVAGDVELVSDQLTANEVRYRTIWKQNGEEFQCVIESTLRW